MRVVRAMRKIVENIMYLVYIRLLCLFHSVLALPANLDNFTFPPQGTFCLFTSSEFIFEVLMNEIAPSAKLQGPGKLKNFYAYLPNPGTPVTVGADSQNPLELKNLWGVVYYIMQEDYSKVEQFAYKQSMISDVMVEVQTNTDQQRGQTLECMTMDVGILPQAFPISIHAMFNQEVDCHSYCEHLAEVGVPRDYIASLSMLPSPTKHMPRSSTPTSFVSPPIQPAQPDAYAAMPLATASNDLSADKLCVFTAGELIFPDAMTKVVPSAKLLGAGMLMDNYLGLGGDTEADHFVKFEGFDHIWGATYAIDQNDLYAFSAYGQQYIFLADVQTEVKGLDQVTCKTFDMGLLPSAFPFSIFKEGNLNAEKYVEQLHNLGAPAGYVSTISSLAEKVREQQNLPDPTNKIGSWVY